MTECTHQREVRDWIDEYVDDWGTTIPGEWQYSMQSTTEDLDIGRFQCTQCKKVMYYTGLWRDFFEKGVPCPGSDRVRR
jgi:hypothetical protein